VLNGLRPLVFITLPSLLLAACGSGEKDAELIEGEVPQTAALTAAARAAASPAGKGNCAEIAGYTMAWAAKMPASFPVYPRANVQEAAGTDEGGCALRNHVFDFAGCLPARLAGFPRDQLCQLLALLADFVGEAADQFDARVQWLRGPCRPGTPRPADGFIDVAKLAPPHFLAGGGIMGDEQFVRHVLGKTSDQPA